MERLRPICKSCGINPVTHSGFSRVSGIRLWKTKCTSCHRYRKYQNIKTDTCEKCGFKAANLCQMDIHHIDGNHSNNDIKNLQTLCACCHRLVHVGPRNNKTKEILIKESDNEID
jgi:hypothetical protein